jgi:anti-sigma factor RsiW
MSCCPINDIYDYIEGLLPAARKQEMEEHLKACPGCRRAVEKRQLIAAAASTLPSLEVPAGFTETVMSRIGPAKSRLPAWLVALGSLLARAAAGAVGLAASGRSLLGTVLDASHAVWGYTKGAAVILAKAMTLLSLIGKTIQSLLESAARGLDLANSLVNPALLVVLLGVTMVLIIGLALAARKKTSLGDEP